MEEYKDKENKYIEISKIIEKQLKDIESRDNKKDKVYKRIYKKIKSAIYKMTEQLKTIF